MFRTTVILLAVLLGWVGQAQKTKKTMKELLKPYQFTSHEVEIDSLKISYVKEGRGSPTLVFLHGLSSNLDAWANNIEELKSNYTCIALDLPGYGKSSKPNAEYTPTFFAEITARFLERLKLEKVVLIGHSMGGQAAIKLAVARPDLVGKLVLVAPAGIERFSESSATLLKGMLTVEAVKNTTDEQIERNYALNFYRLPETANKMIEDRKSIRNSTDFDRHVAAILSSVHGMLDDPVFDILDKIPQETMIIFGKNDSLIPNKYLNPTLTTTAIGKLANEKIKNSELYFVDESGHFVQFETPKEVNLRIEAFIGQ